MIVTEETWYIVRNTRGVTGFVGSGTDPIPLTDEEIRAMGFDESAINVNYEVNDSVKILQGAFKDSIGTVKEINKEKHRVKVLISGKSYTYRTLRYLTRLYPRNQYYFILGEDSLESFSTWRKPQAICDCAQILAAVRQDLAEAWATSSGVTKALVMTKPIT